MAKKIKLYSLPAAVRAMLKAGDDSLAMRPAYWTGTGEALVHHGGNFYRHPMNGESKPYVLSASDAAGRWEVVASEVVTEEALNPAPMPDASDAAPKKRRGRKPRDPNAPPKTKNPDGRRGRPSAATVSADHPGWAGVADAAEACGVNVAKVRQAIKEGKLAVITDRACVLVEVEKVRAVVPPSVPGRGRPRKVKESNDVTEDAPGLAGIVDAAPSEPVESYA